MTLSIGQITSSFFTPVLVINVTFAFFIFAGTIMTAKSAFVVISLF